VSVNRRRGGRPARTCGGRCRTDGCPRAPETERRGRLALSSLHCRSSRHVEHVYARAVCLNGRQHHNSFVVVLNGEIWPAGATCRPLRRQARHIDSSPTAHQTVVVGPLIAQRSSASDVPAAMRSPAARDPIPFVPIAWRGTSDLRTGTREAWMSSFSRAGQSTTPRRSDLRIERGLLSGRHSERTGRRSSPAHRQTKTNARTADGHPQPSACDRPSVGSNSAWFTKPPHYGKKASVWPVLAALVLPVCNCRAAFSCRPRSRPAYLPLERPEQPLGPSILSPRVPTRRRLGCRFAPYFDEGDITAPVAPLTALA